jgi:hypothetical protein
MVPHDIVVAFDADSDSFRVHTFYSRMVAIRGGRETHEKFIETIVTISGQQELENTRDLLSSVLSTEVALYADEVDRINMKGSP